jgi:PAS domain S-box-containing protein
LFAERLMVLTSDAIVGADLETEMIVMWNPAATTLFGYTEDDAIGMRLDRIVPDALRDQHLAGIRRYRETKRAVLVGGDAVEVPAVTKDGREVDVALTITDVSSPGEPYVVAIIRDITEEKRIQRQLQQTNAAMRDFVATASHDLRTPLTSVIGFSQGLVDHGDTMPAAQITEFGTIITRNARRASRLVDDLLTLSQVDAGAIPVNAEAVAVAAAVREVVERVSSGVQCSVDEAVVALVDGDHLERIVGNLVTNALRHGEPPITVSSRAAGDHVELLVCDGGKGVDGDFVERLFTRFARADSSNPDGTGLGLAIVRGLAVANGGDAFYEPAPAGGACFGVRLPLVDGERS